MWAECRDSEHDSADAYRIAYDEAVRALAEQRTDVDSVRANAGILLSAAAIATSFLGGAAIRDGNLTGLGWLATVLFGALCVCAFAIVWPRNDWEFVAGPRRVIATYIEGDEPLPLPRIHRDLALHMEESYDANQWRLTWLARCLRAAIFVLGLEVLAWFLDLGTRS